MNKYITSYSQWLSAFKKNSRAIWVKVSFSNGQEIYFSDYKDWQDIKSICQSEGLGVDNISLQYKSHIINIDTQDSDGVYLVRALRGQIGGDSRQYYTVGVIDEGVVKKGMWLTPELIEEENYEDTLDNCFEQAIIYNHARKSHTQEPV
jgi:hypothetical protein